MEAKQKKRLAEQKAREASIAAQAEREAAHVRLAKESEGLGAGSRRPVPRTRRQVDIPEEQPTLPPKLHSEQVSAFWSPAAPGAAAHSLARDLPLVHALARGCCFGLCCAWWCVQLT